MAQAKEMLDELKDNAPEVEILSPSKIIYSPDKPLSCGAHVWIETEDEVVVLR